MGGERRTEGELCGGGKGRLCGSGKDDVVMTGVVVL